MSQREVGDTLAFGHRKHYLGIAKVVRSEERKNHNCVGSDSSMLPPPPLFFKINFIIKQ